MNSYIAFDLETTGFAPETCDIIEIGAWKIKDGVAIDKFCTLVKPIMYIPMTIQNITGITMDDVADCETLDTVLVEFFDWCEDYNFLGHNLPFDYRFIEYKGKYLGLDFSLKGKRQGIDTLNLCRKYLNLDSNKLKEVANSMGIATDSTNGAFHRAGYDAYVTKLIYDRFLFQYPKVLDVIMPKSLSQDENKYGKVVNNDTLEFN